MSFDYNKAIQRILAKATVLEERYSLVLKSQKEALDKIEELQKEVVAKDKELEQLRLQVHYLQMASTVAPSREQVEAARALITSLVRDIDRCITDLSD